MKSVLTGLLLVAGLSLVSCAHHCGGGKCDRGHAKHANCGKCEEGKDCKKGDEQCDRSKKACCDEAKKAEEAAKTATPAK